MLMQMHSQMLMQMLSANALANALSRCTFSRCSISYCTVTPLFAISINYRGFYCLLESRSIMVYCLCLLHKLGHTFTSCCTRYVYICTMTFYGSLCNNAIVIATISAFSRDFRQCFQQMLMQRLCQCFQQMLSANAHANAHANAFSKCSCKCFQQMLMQMHSQRLFDDQFNLLHMFPLAKTSSMLMQRLCQCFQQMIFI